jgi:hypothetical protein
MKHESMYKLGNLHNASKKDIPLYFSRVCGNKRLVDFVILSHLYSRGIFEIDHPGGDM